MHPVLDEGKLRKVLIQIRNDISVPAVDRRYGS